MSRGIGELQQALLAAIQDRGCIDTLVVARCAYKLGRRAAVSDAQHAATRRALAGLAKRGLVVHLGRHFRRALWCVARQNGEQIQLGATGGGKAGEIDPATVERFCAMLQPRRKRYPLDVVMQRLAAEARKNEDQFEWLAPPQGEDPTVPREEWEAQEDELVVEIANCGPLEPSAPVKPRAGRADHERYVALLVGVVFHEYTGKSPKRIWDAYQDTDHNSPFYIFAAAVFRWLGLAPSWQAFREVSERWDSSREFSKRAIKVLLFRDRENEEDLTASLAAPAKGRRRRAAPRR
jgi:hypothetical protein